MLTYNFIETAENGVNLVLFYNYRPYTYTDKSHTSFYELLDAVRAYGAAWNKGEDTKQLMENVATFLKPEYNVQVLAISPKLTEYDGEIQYGGVTITGAIVERILNFKRKNLPYEPLWNFLEKVLQNPDARSREQLYTFIENNPFPPISMDGDILAYKKVRSDWTSVNSGYGIVNGVEYTKAHLDNTIGNNVRMPRDKVNADPNVGCSYGLHVGSWQYVSSFSGDIVVIVKVNPKDVVSVPSDCSFQKIRVCEYNVVAEFDGNELTEEVISTYDAPELEGEYTTAVMSDETVASKMHELFTDEIDGKYHLANRFVNSTGLTLTPDERKEMVENYSTVAEQVLAEIATEEFIAFVDDNSHTIFPCDNKYHFAARIMNINLGRHNWTIAGNKTDYDKFVEIGENIIADQPFGEEITLQNWIDYSSSL